MGENKNENIDIMDLTLMTESKYCSPCYSPYW